MQSKLLLTLVGGFALTAFAQSGSVPSGSDITVRTNESIDLSDADSGRAYSAVVERDVVGTDGNVVIPRGANAELMVKDLGNGDHTVDLESITYRGRRYVVAAADQLYESQKKEGIGKNSRTGKYVGGGAAVGAIIGAIAGGGKGAAIGAITGAGAGAAGQVLTRGKSGKVPAESVLTFQLERPLTVGTGRYSRDNGFMDNGRHYHRRDRDNNNNY